MVSRLLGLLVGIASLGAHQADPEFRTGFARVDITPPKGAIMTGPALPIAKDTEDRLFAKAMVARSGGRTLAIVGMDLVKIRKDLAEEATRLAAERTGLDPRGILLCPTHNHSSPWVPRGGPGNRKYLEEVPGRIAECIERAHRDMRPARMKIGRSLVYRGLNNRRFVSKADGKVLNNWLGKLDDLEAVPQVLGSEGPIDPEMWVARFESTDGKVMGLLVNFTCHPNLRQRKDLRSWSADFPGVISEKLRELHGENVVTVFPQGASGNLNPASGQTRNWRAEAEIFANAAAEAAQSARRVQEPVEIDYARRDVRVPRRDPASQADEAIARLGWRVEAFEAAGESVSRLPESRETPVSAARIGPLGIASNPGELFVEWGIDIKRRSSFRHTIVCELVNDSIGYEPTAAAFENGGYETLVGVNFVTLEGIEELVDTAVALLDELAAPNHREPR